MGLSIALLHYPAIDKLGDAVVTSVLNFDVHDIARAARTYGLDHYFIVTPIEMQRDFVGRIMNHWIEGKGAVHNPTRGESLANVEVVADLTVVGDRIVQKWGGAPYWVATSARASGTIVTTTELRAKLDKNDQNVCILFGTGHGIHPDLFELVDAVLEPLRGPTDYNHLSVRSAVSIYLDRLLRPQVREGD